MYYICMINKNIMKKIVKINKYQEGGIVSKKPKKIDLNNVTADPRQGGKCVTGDPRLQTVGPHLYELPKNFAPINPTGKKQIATDENETHTKKSKPKLTNSRQRGYVTGGSSPALKSRTNNAKKGQATSGSKTCTTTGCSKF
jgi:hypothetical protein